MQRIEKIRKNEKEKNKIKRRRIKEKK